MIKKNKFSEDFDYATLLLDLTDRINSETLELLARKYRYFSNPSQTKLKE